MSQRFGAVVLLVMLAIAPPLMAEETVVRFSGSNSDTTREFEVQAPWILRWRVGSEYRYSMGFELALLNAATGYQHSRIMKIKSTGSGTKLFDESGRFRFRISATLAQWDLRVVELTEAEADALVPVKKPGDDMIRKR